MPLVEESRCITTFYSFPYNRTIKGHTEIFYNLEFNSVNKNYFSCIGKATIEK